MTKFVGNTLIPEHIFSHFSHFLSFLHDTSFMNAPKAQRHLENVRLNLLKFTFATNHLISDPVPEGQFSQCQDRLGPAAGEG